MAKLLVAMASTLVGDGFQRSSFLLLVAMASTLVAMASNVVATSCY